MGRGVRVRTHLYGWTGLGLVVTALTVVMAALFLNNAAATSDESGKQSRGDQVAVAQADAEAELAEKYAPILLIASQNGECDSGGSPYDPAPVDIVLGNPAVELQALPDREVTATAPTGEEIADLPAEYYLNWPGNPRKPGCGYERDYMTFAADHRPTIYSHVATEDGSDGVAVQYWFFYYYNDFANKHEGDWEMVQVMFDDANTAEEALQQEPTRTAYSSHGGGETGKWTDSKLHKEGDRPVVYAAKGSNASYYSEGTFIGVAKRGEVFGCDPTIGPHRRVDPDVVLMPDQATTRGEFAWLSFAGRWGREDGDLFSGIMGPAARERWDEPFTWANGLRDFSDKIPDSLLGIDPVGAICIVVNAGSDAMIFAQERPYVVAVGVVGAMAAAGGTFVYGVPNWLTGRAPTPAGTTTLDPLEIGQRGFLRRERRLKQLGRAALRLYAANWQIWMFLGAVMVAFALVIMLAEQLLGTEWLANAAGNSVSVPFAQLLGMTVGAVVGAYVIAAATFATLRRLDEGRQPAIADVLRDVAGHAGRLLAQVLLQIGLIGLLVLTVVGIPIAINRLVSWSMAGQVIMFEDASPRGSLRRSAELVRGSWWRVASTLVLIGLFIGLLGPAIAFAFLLLAEPPAVEVVYPVLTLLYVLALFPLAFITSGLLYGDLCALQSRRREQAGRGANA